MVKRYKDDTMLGAATGADQLQEDGDMAGVAARHILNAIERLQAAKPAEGEKVQ